MTTGEEARADTHILIRAVHARLEAAAQEFRFVPHQPQNELEYKRAYAKVAAAAARAAGTPLEQVAAQYQAHYSEPIENGSLENLTAYLESLGGAA